MFFHTDHQGALLISTSRFEKGDGANRIVQFNSVLSVTDPALPFASQVELVLTGINSLPMPGVRPVFVRIFLSDPANQAPFVEERLKTDCPVSVIGQAPLNGTKIAAWVWYRSDAYVTAIRDGLHRISWHGTEELWFTCGTADCDGSYGQTVKLLDQFSADLEAQGMTLEDDCVRTWLFVQNIDVNYRGVVDGRNDVFDRHALTPDTHFIASTGIEGRTLSHDSKVMLDAVAVKGQGVSQSYLYGSTHLNRTSEYGVRFERGTVVRYPDLRHVFISGTASIDNKGHIMHEGDIAGQTARMIENVEVLLSEAGCGFADVAAMTVYLRDPSDYATVNRIFSERFPDHPRIITMAPVCRPGWLIEIECVAIY